MNDPTALAAAWRLREPGQLQGGRGGLRRDGSLLRPVYRQALAHPRPNGAGGARGVRNISEGSGAAATSRKSEMKLTNVARASLSDELAKDYKSFLIQRGLRVWQDSPRRWPCANA